MEIEKDTGIPVMYKAFDLRPDGTMESIKAIPGYPVLKYTEGQITRAPKDSKGIYVGETYAAALTAGKSNSANVNQLVVHEVIPLGLIGVGSMVTYPAVVVGKRVYPEPVAFQVGDTVGWHNKYGEELQKREVLSIEGDRLIFQTGWMPANECELISHEPEPVWKDVTNECTIKFQKSAPTVIMVSHNDEVQFFVTACGVRRYVNAEGEYKVKIAGEGFTILHLS